MSYDENVAAKMQGQKIVDRINSETFEKKNEYLLETMHFFDFRYKFAAASLAGWNASIGRRLHCWNY